MFTCPGFLNCLPLTTLNTGDNIIKLVIEHILLLLLSGKGGAESPEEEVIS